MEIEAVETSGGLMALPPEAQEAAEEKAIQNHPQTQELLDNEAVLDVIKQDNGYLVLSENIKLEIKIHYLPSKLLGPAQFELKFGQPTSRFDP